MAMWRRALLGSRDDVVRVGSLGGAMVVGLVLVLAGTVSWPVGTAAGWVLGGSGLLLFRWRRRRWDRTVAHLALEVVAEAEHALGGRTRRPPLPPDPATGA